jgi:hypothetical protein
MNITIPKYRRLCLVLFLPLLLLGFLSANILMPYERILMALCVQSSSGKDDCRDVGKYNGDYYKSVMKRSIAWFDVEASPFERNPTITQDAMASIRMVPDAEIVEARGPYGPEINNTLEKLVGMRANVSLGIYGEARSIIEGNIVYLQCNSLSFDVTPGVYTSLCFGGGWAPGAVSFTYRVDAPYRGGLDQLRSSINIAMDAKRFEYFTYMIVMYPIFIYAFFVLSVLAWVTARAIRYVKEG